MPIKYIGSKRRLVPALGALLSAAGARTALDLFTGTTRVAYEFKKRGAEVTALDSATYSKVFADCYIGTDSLTIDKDDLRDALAFLQGLPGQPGYFTETFCVQSRYFRPDNGAKVDAIRDAIETDFRGSSLYPILLTSLIEAADRVDSTTGLQNEVRDPVRGLVVRWVVGPIRVCQHSKDRNLCSLRVLCYRARTRGIQPPRCARASLGAAPLVSGGCADAAYPTPHNVTLAFEHSVPLTRRSLVRRRPMSSRRSHSRLSHP